MRSLNQAISERLAIGRELVLGFWPEERAQDITEYTLLLAFVVISAAALLVLNGASITGIWGDAQVVLTKADQQASSS